MTYVKCSTKCPYIEIIVSFLLTIKEVELHSLNIFFNYGKTQINSERKGITHFNQKAAELLNLKKSLFLSCDGLLENFSLRRI